MRADTQSEADEGIWFLLVVNKAIEMLTPDGDYVAPATFSSQHGLAPFGYLGHREADLTGYTRTVWVRGCSTVSGEMEL